MDLAELELTPALTAAIESAVAERTRALREVLRPFGVCAHFFDGLATDATAFQASAGVQLRIRVGEVRRALAVLEATAPLPAFDVQTYARREAEDRDRFRSSGPHPLQELAS